MNKNVTALILIVLAVGIYFTYTSGKIDELKTIQATNNEYQTALDNVTLLTTNRDKLTAENNNISPDDDDRLNKILPDTADNVRLIIDTQNNIAASHGLFLKGIKTTVDGSSDDASSAAPADPTAVNRGGTISGVPATYGTIDLSFDVTTDYQTFISFLKDLESNLRVMDISHLSVAPNDSGSYDFSVDITTYYLKSS